MSPDLRLVEGLYVHPTPRGAFQAVRSVEPTPERLLLRHLLRQPVTPELSASTLVAWTGRDLPQAIDLVWCMQQENLLVGEPTPREAPSRSLEETLPELLEPLASRGEALLADPQGFCLAAVGFDAAAATEWSAVSADLASLHERHGDALRRHSPLQSGAWSLVDGAGNSHVGFWPLHIGTTRFVLVLAGLPRLNQPELTELIWSLSSRYDRDEATSDHRSTASAAPSPQPKQGDRNA